MVRDAERAEKGLDFYGIDEKKSSTPSGIVAMIHKKWALPAVHPKILIQKTLKTAELWQEEFERRRLRLKHVVKLRQSSCCGLFGAYLYNIYIYGCFQK